MMGIQLDNLEKRAITLLSELRDEAKAQGASYHLRAVPVHGEDSREIGMRGGDNSPSQR